MCVPAACMYIARVLACPARLRLVFVCLCMCLIHLNQVQFSHFLSPSTLSVAAGDKNHLRWSKMTENNGEISSASFCSPIYSARSEWALSGRTHRDIPPPSLFYLDFILPTQTFHFLTDWGTLFNSFIHLCLQAGTDVTVNKNGRALQAPLLPLPFVCKVAAVNLIEGECCDYLMVSQAAMDWRIKFRICFPRR